MEVRVLFWAPFDLSATLRVCARGVFGEVSCRRRAGFATGPAAAAPSRAEVIVLTEYLPVLLFLVVSAGVGIALIVIGNLLGPKRPQADKNSRLRVRLRGVRGRAHAVRRALLPDRDPVHHLRSRNRVRVSVGDRVQQLGLVGLVEMGMFLSLLVLGLSTAGRRERWNGNECAGTLSNDDQRERCTTRCRTMSSTTSCVRATTIR